MKAKEAINILKMFNPETEVELVFPDAMLASPVAKPKKPLTEGEMAMLPMHPDPCPQCIPGGVCRTSKCGRAKIYINHPAI